MTPLLERAESQLDRSVNASVYTPEEFARKLAAKNHFLTSILEEEKVFILGGYHDLEQIAGIGFRRRRIEPANRRSTTCSAVGRNLHDADLDALSADNRFGLAYEAVLLLAKMAIACAGYRIKGQGAHQTTFAALPLVLGPSVSTNGILLRSLPTQRKRNQLRRGRCGHGYRSRRNF